MIFDKKGLFLLTAALTLSAAAIGAGNNKSALEARADGGLETVSDYPLDSHTYRKIYDKSDLQIGDKFIFAMQDADGVYRAMSIDDSGNKDPAFLSSESFTVEFDYKNRVFAIDQFASGANPAIWTLDAADESEPGKKFGQYSYRTWVAGNFEDFRWLIGGDRPLRMAGYGLPASFDIDSSTGAVTTRFYRRYRNDITNDELPWTFFGGNVRVISEDDGVTYVPVDYSNNCLDEDGNVGHLDNHAEFVLGAVEEYEYTTPTYDLYIFKVENGIVSHPKTPHVTFTLTSYNVYDINVYDDPEPAHIDGWHARFFTYIPKTDYSIVQGGLNRYSFSLGEPYTILGLSVSAKVGTEEASNEGTFVFSNNGSELRRQGNYTDIFVVGPAASDGYSNFVAPLPGPISVSEEQWFNIECTRGRLFVKSFTVYYSTAYSEFSSSVGVTSNLGFSYDMEGETVTSISKVSLKFKCSIPNSALANISNPTGFGATVRAEGSENTMDFEAGTDKISENADGKFFTFAINNVPRTAFKTELTITPYINADIGGNTKTIYLPEKTMSVKRLIEAYQGEAASALSELQAFLIDQFATYFAADLAD